MCGTGPAWKREEVRDHKFDFIDTSDYHTKNWGVRLQYFWIYILVIKSFLVYLSDIYTAVTMLTSNGWTNAIYAKCPENECPVSFTIGKWIFVGCIIFSFLLLAYESRKAKRIIASRDISYAFTNVMANWYYSLRSYNHFCFFSTIESSTKKKDDFAFFIFFTFKEWKRLLLADGPRQCINGMTLYSFWVANGRGNPFEKYASYYNGSYVTAGLLITMIFTVLIFVGSALLLVIAAVLYIPLLCYIRGNLKEYCCHKVDKRIAELLKKKAEQRVRQAKKEAAGDFSHLKGKKGAAPPTAGKQPTLPVLTLDDDMVHTKSRSIGKLDDMYYPDSKSEYAASAYTANQSTPYHEYPPMPGYFGQDTKPGAESLYSYEQSAYINPAEESTAHLAYSGAPIAGHEHGYYDQQQYDQYQYDQQHYDQYQYAQHQQQQYGADEAVYNNAPAYNSNPHERKRSKGNAMQ